MQLQNVWFSSVLVEIEFETGYGFVHSDLELEFPLQYTYVTLTF